MLKLKSCPKCKTGAVGIDRDHYGWYEYCIQCGYVRDLIGMVESGQEHNDSGKERRREVKISDTGEQERA
jgi:hypothetical protein